MTLLLDTHVLVWALISPARLRPGLHAALTATETKVLFSAASIWEVAVKRSLGRLDFGFQPESVAQAALDTRHRRSGADGLPGAGALGR